MPYAECGRQKQGQKLIVRLQKGSEELRACEIYSKCINYILLKRCFDSSGTKYIKVALNAVTYLASLYSLKCFSTPFLCGSLAFLEASNPGSWKTEGSRCRS